MNATLIEIARLVQGDVVGGDHHTKISTLSPIDNIEADALVFAEGEHNIKTAEASGAAAMLVGKHVHHLKKPLIQVFNPFQAFITLLDYFYPTPQSKPGIHPTAVIAENVDLGKEVTIGPYVVIESGSKIGDACVIKGHVHIGHQVTINSHTTIHPHVTIYNRCQIGQRVQIHASAVIGSDGFGYIVDVGKHAKIPHVGNVIIEDDVEVGASTVIDRATLGSTVIGQGSKIDNLVQIAHSVKLGKHNILCAFTGIAGSSVSGDHVIFAANVGVSDHVRIDDGVILGARAGVPPKKHLKQGNIYMGNPARPKNKAIEHELSTSRIPIMRKNLRALSEKVETIADKIKQLEEK